MPEGMDPKTTKLELYEVIEDQEHYYVISEFMKGGELYDRIL